MWFEIKLKKYCNFFIFLKINISNGEFHPLGGAPIEILLCGIGVPDAKNSLLVI